MSKDSDNSCLAHQTTFFDSTPKPGKLIFALTIPGRLPSWNDILGMEQWARYKFKKELSDVFMFALQQSERASSTGTISAKNTMSIFCAIHLREYLETAQQRRLSRSANKKLKLEKEKKSGSKFLKSKVPF